MFAILNLVLPLFGLILIGFAAGRLIRLPLEGLAWLNMFVLYFAVPALIFRLLYRTPVSELSSLSFIATTTFGTLLIFCLTFFIAGFRNGGNVGEATIQGFAGAYGNIGYLGPPLAIAAFGPEAGVPVALVFCFDNAMHFTLAPFLMSFHTKNPAGTLRMVREILTRICTHPFIVATFAALLVAWTGVEVPTAIDGIIGNVADAAAPCALFALGVTAAIRPLKRIPPELGYILPIKLLIHPLLIYWLLWLVAPETDSVWIKSAVLLAALPCATNVYVLAQQYDVWKERASSAVVISTLISIVTVTIFLYLAETGILAF